MADKEFGKKCQRCGKTGGETFARVFYKPIDGKWLRLCGVCWNAVEQSFAPDAFCECPPETSTSNVNPRICPVCEKPHR